MKKYSIILFCLLPLTGISQPVLTYRTHGLQPETINTMQQVSYVAPGNGGRQVLWDFNNVNVIGSSDTKETVSLADDGELKVTNAAGGKFSYTCDAAGNVFEGYQDTNQTLIYDLPIKKVTYPFSFGDALSGNFSARTLYPNSNMEHHMAGSYSSEADGYGTLVLPGGRVLKNVLRLKTVEKYVEDRCQTADVEMVKYLWYIEEYRYPVFVTWDISYSYANGHRTTSQASFYTTATLPQPEDRPVYEPDITVKSDNTGHIQHSVYPNPYGDYFHITYTLDKPTTVTITLYSLTGNLVSEIVRDQLQDGVQHVSYTPRDNETTGTYYLRLQFGDKVYVRALLKN